jgi:nucleoside-diphosphate-sugar epimerase
MHVTRSFWSEEEAVMWRKSCTTLPPAPIQDLVDGMIALMESNYSLPVNLGNPDEYTIREFAEMIRSMVDTKVELKFMPATEVCGANPTRALMARSGISVTWLLRFRYPCKECAEGTARKESGGISILVLKYKMYHRVPVAFFLVR